MTKTGRPVRALVVVLTSWTAVRVAMLWPDDRREPTQSVGSSPTQHVERPARNPLLPAEPQSTLIVAAKGDIQSANVGRARVDRLPILLAPQAEPFRASTQAARASTITPEVPTAADALTRSDGLLAASIPGLTSGQRARRFTGAMWSVMRGEGSSGLAQGGQLGGSQAGLRIFYTPGAGQLAATARLSAALSRKTGREAALGIALRGRNFGLIAEQRFALDTGSRNAPAIFGYGGMSDVAIGNGVVIDGYVQGGAVGIARPALFIDGAIRAERVVIQSANATVSAGAGAWGGAQPGSRRLDIGPQVVTRLALADRQWRISAEWRYRIAGNAAPGSGPSVTIGVDF